MGFDVNGTSVTNGGGDLKINYSTNVIQQFTSTGNLRRNISMTPMFFVGGSTASWVALTASTWVTLVFDTIAQNNRSCYSTSTGRFTAPVSGLYLLSGTTYNYQDSSSYLYPMFFVNGSATGNRIGAANYRPKGYMVPAGGYAFDGALTEIIYLFAGDYIEYREWSNGVQGYWYPPYASFSGVLLG